MIDLKNNPFIKSVMNLVKLRKIKTRKRFKFRLKKLQLENDNFSLNAGQKRKGVRAGRKRKLK